ncbi:hypothetical protein SRB17_64370 [Streptomyces sp. RB17]|uniref:hypothetical protein n=1 Tax=Streptomyces sp. RB17 TaxID=2585197 RepID=UPI0013069CC3|nr:hypothetical protein [Streptomyces sp. RB17]MQY38424.1 hypothetical protein [Streptomyces sp. RB17]
MLRRPVRPLQSCIAEAAGTLRLFTEVLRHLDFRAERMAEACEREFLGGFSLANALTTAEDVSWRRAPADGDPELLRRVAREQG